MKYSFDIPIFCFFIYFKSENALLFMLKIKKDGLF